MEDLAIAISSVAISCVCRDGHDDDHRHPHNDCKARVVRQLVPFDMMMMMIIIIIIAIILLMALPDQVLCGLPHLLPHRGHHCRSFNQ